MAPDIIDHEARLRRLEALCEKTAWVVDSHDRLIPKLAERCETVAAWQRDRSRDEARERAGLTRREKWIGAALVSLVPLLTVLVQHVFK